MNVYYNDIDPYCCKVLTKNIAHGNLPGGYVDGRDIRDVRADDLVGYTHIHLFAGIGGIPLGFKWAGVPEHIRILTGGFPCQPHSVAGKRRASTDERDLWGEFYRIVCDIRPTWIVAENVPGLLSSEHGRFFGRILRDMAQAGYDAKWRVFSAAQFGAPHLRERVFIVAYHRSQRVQRLWTQKVQRVKAFSWCQNVRSIEDLHHRSHLPPSLVWGDRNGIPSYMDRIRTIGNAVVPQIAEYIGHCIVQAHLERQLQHLEVVR